MIAVAILFVIIIFGLFFLFRAMGSMGQRPAPQQRTRHSAGDGRGPGPRASGLN